MGINAQQVLQNDPEYLARQLAQQEIQRYQNFQNPQQGLASTSGALLGRGLANLFGGRGFFEVSDPALRKVSQLQSLYNDAMQDFDPNDPAKAYTQLATTLSKAGYGKEAAMAVAEANKFNIQQKELTLKAAELGLKAGTAKADVTKQEQDAIKFYTDNPDQAQFELQRLAQLIEANPNDQDALDRYNKIAAAGQTGSMARAAKEEKEQLGTAKDKALLAKYNKDLEDARKFGPAERWQAEKQAALNLLKNYKIDVTKPLAGQINASVLYSPMGAEITNAYERAVRPNVPSSFTMSPTPAPASTPAPAVSTKPPSIEDAVKRSGQTYEPNKYEYRVLANGAVQRRLKGQ